VNAPENHAAHADPASFQPRAVTVTDLPLGCPMPDAELWNAHPRVYLPIEKTGRAKCPYCSAEYVLQR